LLNENSILLGRPVNIFMIKPRTNLDAKYLNCVLFIISIWLIIIGWA
jgi:hypothetical protein